MVTLQRDYFAIVREFVNDTLGTDSSRFETADDLGEYIRANADEVNALKGLGATARFVMLPHESHGYRARESVMHMLWKSNEWLERYVKNVGPR